MSPEDFGGQGDERVSRAVWVCSGRLGLLGTEMSKLFTGVICVLHAFFSGKKLSTSQRPERPEQKQVFKQRNHNRVMTPNKNRKLNKTIQMLGTLGTLGTPDFLVS